MAKTCLPAPQITDFIDHRAVDWQRVKRTRCQFYQRFEYVYPGPIYNLKQRLVIIPADQYGTQHLLNHQLTVSPLAVPVRQQVDNFGNRIMELEVAEVDGFVSFEAEMNVERALDNAQRRAISSAEAVYFLRHTTLTMPDEHIAHIARQERAKALTEIDLAHQINDRVSDAMRYTGDLTSVDTSAAQALALGGGLCQDYAHLMLAICRTAGLPARYVSGHLLGEGGSHAWVEVFIQSRGGFKVVAFDPTNRRQPHLGYVTVAVGRDYDDVAPTSGSFTAPYGGTLKCSKRAGLTLVEYRNGDIFQSRMVS